MSFSSDVKDELKNHTSHATHCRIAELSAMVMLSGDLRIDEDKKSLVIKTEAYSAAVKLKTLLKQLFKINITERVTEGTTREVYRFEISNEEEIISILQKLKLSGSGKNLLPGNIVFTSDCCKRAFLRGAFLSSGSVNNPEKAYHLEIVTDSLEKAEKLCYIMKCFDFEPKTVTRKKYEVVYLKEGQQIVELLGIMEAHISLLNMENVRIVKDIRNQCNRQVNCEAANIKKTAKAAVKQTEDIMFIINTKGIASLPEGLRQIALLRMEDSELSLKELGEMLDPPLGKSGVNHRLRKISEIAEKLRQS